MKDSSKVALQLGLYRNHYHPFSELTIAYERALKFPRISVLVAVGINPISRKDWTLPLWRFNWSVRTELHYFFAMRRGMTLSGFFAGALVSFDHAGYYFDGTTSPNLTGEWLSFGPTIGYQHRITDRILIGYNFATGITPFYITKVYDQPQQLSNRYRSGFGWQYYSFIKLGFTL